MDLLAPANLLAAPESLAPRFLEPMGLRWGRFTTRDGASLRWARLPGTGASPLPCVLLGGFTEFTEKYFETMRDLAKRGLSVWFLDWRDQGGSQRSGDKPGARDYDRDADDLTAFMARYIPAGPRVIIAHSMGAAITLLALKNNPKLADAAVLSAPMLGLHTAWMPWFVARFVAWIGNSGGFATSFLPGAGPWTFDDLLDARNSPTSHCAARCLIHRTWFEAQPRLRVNGPTFAWAEAAFRFCTRITAPAFLKDIATPLLIGSAAQEFFVSPAAQHRAARHLPDCRLAEFPDARHELFMEDDTVRDRWFAAIDDFIATRVPRP